MFAREHLGADLRASVVVFLVALPLCLGIALASGAPLLSGLVAGIIGGLIVAPLSRSELMVSGPAAGLTAVVLQGIHDLGSFPAFLTALVLAGLMQLGLGLLRAGQLASFVPGSVVRAMLVGIGLILILKQIPHALGYDADAMGDESFAQANHENTFGALLHAFSLIEPGAVVVSLVGGAVLALWSSSLGKRLRVVPGPLAAVVLATLTHEVLRVVQPAWALEPTHLVTLPDFGDPAAVWSTWPLPSWAALSDGVVYRVALTVAIVASLETLLSLEAVDRLDPLERRSPPDTELVAQGVGNTLAGLVGGLPLTGVIVRSAVNVESGGRTRTSAFVHALWLVLAVVALPGLLARVPLAALAIILLQTGYKLAHPKEWRAAYLRGPVVYVPFVATVLGILLTDLLWGIALGLVVGLAYLVREQARAEPLRAVHPPGSVLKRFVLPPQATFLQRVGLRRQLEALTQGDRVEVDARESYLDPDIEDLFAELAPKLISRGVDLRLVGFPTLTTPSGH